MDIETLTPEEKAELKARIKAKLDERLATQQPESAVQPKQEIRATSNPLTASFDERARLMASGAVNPLGTLIAAGKTAYNGLTSDAPLDPDSYPLMDSPSWGEIGSDAAINMASVLVPELKIAQGAGRAIFPTLAKSYPILTKTGGQVVDNALGTAAQFGMQEATEAAGWRPETDDTATNLTSLAAGTVLPMGGGASEAMRKTRYDNIAKVAESDRVVAAKLGGGTTNTRTQRAFGDLLSDADRQDYLLRSEVDKGVDFDPIQGKMTGELPTGTTYEQYTANLDRNHAAARQTQSQVSTQIDQNLALNRMTFLDPARVQAEIISRAKQLRVAEGLGSAKAKVVADGLEELGATIGRVDTLEGLNTQIGEAYGLLREGKFFDLSPQGKAVIDPSARAALSTAYNESLIEAVGIMRQLRAERLNDLFANASWVSQGLPAGFDAKAFANVSEFLHNTIPVRQGTTDIAGSFQRASAPTPGGLIKGGSGAPSSINEAKAGGFRAAWDWVANAATGATKDSKLVDDSAKQLAMMQRAMQFRRTNPAFQQLTIEQLLQHPMFLATMTDDATSPMQKDGTSGALRPKFEVKVPHHSINRNVAAIDQLPPDARAMLLMELAGDLDGPALFEQHMALRQPREKAMFWGNVAKQYPMAPFASADVTGLPSEFDDGTGAKLYHDMDRAAWADKVGKSDLREDVKAQLTAAVFRDGTVFPLERGGELVQLKPSLTQPDVTDRMIQQRVRGRPKTDLING